MFDSSESALTFDSKEGDCKSQKQQTRHATQMFGIGPAICHDDATMGHRLATRR